MEGLRNERRIATEDKTPEDGAVGAISASNGCN